MPDFAAHSRGNLSPQEFDSTHNLGVGHRADTELSKKALVAEELVLEKNLFNDLLGAADQQRTAW